MNPHIQSELALVWVGGGRRYFTRKAALRGAAKAIIRDYLRATGEDPNEVGHDRYQRWISQLVGKIELGERPELDPAESSAPDVKATASQDGPAQDAPNLPERGKL